MKINSIFHPFAAAMLITLASCGTPHPDVPANASSAGRLPVIFPDYTEVTIPSNLCPVNFAVRENGKNTVVRLSAGQCSFTYGDGMKIQIDENEWQELIAAAKGKSIKVEVYVENDGKWTSYNPFNVNVAEESIDEYISYRAIQPSYVAYEELSINQRNVTTFDDEEIYNNMMVSTEKDGQCINCHAYKNYKTDNMLFHMRQSYGGTVIVKDGKVSKVDLKTPEIISAGVYPSWHPTANFIAFSTNNTGQSFHTKSLNKIEVQDTNSDLILYDIDKNEVSIISNRDDELEVFPTWSPDGRVLYFCSAHFEYQNDSLSQEAEMIQRFSEVKYNLCRKSFDPATCKFGETEIIYAAADTGKTVTLPRLSPDGRYIAFAQGDFGCFMVWHPEADIYAIDLQSERDSEGHYLPFALTNLNSDRSESYPSWSSNGRWIMTASRRDDGNYTRPYISYFDKQGKVHKAFELPQRDPNFYTFYLRSFNRPEFMVEPVKVSAQEFAAAAKKDAEHAKFKK